MPQWTAIPWVEYDGLRIQTGDIESNWTSLVVPDISVTWGRGTLLEHAEPGSASITVAARVTASTILQEPQGREVIIGYTYTSPGYEGDRVMFRGRVDTVDIEHFRTADDEDIFIATVVVPGRLTEVARIKIADDVPRVTEFFQARRDWLATKLGSTTAGYIGGGGTTGDGQGYDNYVAVTDYRDEDLLTAIQNLYATSAEAVVYDPQRDIVDGMGMWYDARTTPALFLVWRDGKVAVAPFADGHGTYDAGQALMTSAAVNQDQTISRLSIEGYMFYSDRADDEKWKDGYTLYRDIAGAKPGMEFKPKTLAYRNYLTGFDSRDQSMDLWAPTVDAARLFIPPPITQRHRNGWGNFADMTNTLAGKEVRETQYIMGSVYSAISTAPPFCRPIGGTVRYTTTDAGQGYWETTLTLAPSELRRGINPITLAELNPNAAPATELRRNYATNPSFEADLAGAALGSTATATQVAGGYVGSKAMQVANTSGNSRYAGADSLVPAGFTYVKAACFIKRVSGSPYVTARLGYRATPTTGTINYLAQTTAKTLGNDWVRVNVEGAIPADTQFLRVITYGQDTAATNSTTGYVFLHDAYCISLGTTAANTPDPVYFDGGTLSTDSSAVYAWTGAPGASASIERTSTGFTYDDFNPSLSLLDLANAERGL